MILLYGVTALIILISLIKDRGKTSAGFKSGSKKLLSVLPVFIVMIILVSLLQGFVPDEVISEYLGKSNGVAGVFTALILGSVSLMPGFIIFPLSGILISKGAYYMIIAVFTSSTMLVGLLTMPVENKYLGMRVAVLRNALAIIISLIIGLITGIFYGEL